MQSSLPKNVHQRMKVFCLEYIAIQRNVIGILLAQMEVFSDKKAENKSSAKTIFLEKIQN